MPLNIDGVPIHVPRTLNAGESYTPYTPDLSTYDARVRLLTPIPADVMAEYHRIAVDFEARLVMIPGTLPNPSPASVHEGTPGTAGGALPDLMKVNVPANPNLPSSTGEPRFVGS